MNRSTYLKVTNAAIISTVFGVFLAVAIVLFYSIENKQTKADSNLLLNAVAASKQSQLTDWFNDEVQDAAFISGNHVFIDNVTDFLDGKTDESTFIASLNQIKSEHLYADLVLLKLNGDYITSTDPALAFNDSVEKEILRQAIASDSCYVSDIYRSEIDHCTYIDLVSVIRNNDKVLGGLIFKISPEKQLDIMLTDWYLTNHEGTISLLQKDRGGRLLYYHPSLLSADTLACWYPVDKKRLQTGLEQYFSGVSPSADDMFRVFELPFSKWMVLIEVNDQVRQERLKTITAMLIVVSLILVVIIFFGLVLVIHFWQGKNISKLLSKEAEFDSFKNQYWLTMDVLTEGVIITDSKGLICYMNLMAETISGWKLHEAVGKEAESAIQLLHEDSGLPVLGIDNWFTGEPAFISFNKVLLVDRKGERIDVSVSITPIKSDNPAQNGMIITLRDNTAIRRQELLALKNEQLFKNLFQDAPDAFIIVDKDGFIKLANVNALSLFGYSNEELMAMRVEDLIPEVFGHHTEHRLAYFDNPEKRVIGMDRKILAQSKNGTAFPAFVSLSPILDNDELFVMAVIRNITDMVRKEEIRQFRNQ